MIEVRQTEKFRDWFRRLKDRKAKGRIADRLDRLKLGNLGDVKFVGGGVMEMRIDYGAGYRIYYARRGSELILLLCAGDKRSQDRDIRQAQELAHQWRS